MKIILGPTAKRPWPGSTTSTVQIGCRAPFPSATPQRVRQYQQGIQLVIYQQHESRNHDIRPSRFFLSTSPKTHRSQDRLTQVDIESEQYGHNQP